METFVALISMATFIGTIVAVVFSNHKKVLRKLQNVAHDLGLENVAQQVYRGDIEGQSVRLSFEASSIAIVVKKGSFPAFLTAKNWFGHTQRETQKTGDPEFDQLYELELGSKTVAYLNKRARQALISLARSEAFCVDVSSDMISLSTEGPSFSAKQIRKAIAQAMVFNDEILRPGSLTEIVAGNIAQTSNPHIRLTNLKILVNSCPDDPDAQTILEATVADQNYDICLLAATHLKVDSSKHLIKILEDGDDDQVGRAISLLIRRGSLESSRVLREALTRRKHIVLIMDALARVVDLKAVDAIVSILHEDDMNYDDKRAAYDALSKLAPEKVKHLFLDLLDESDHELLTIAARALGSCGTVDDVERLHRAMENATKKSVRRSLEQAIAEIQSRIEGADAGWLDVADSDGQVGALSLEEAKQGGEISVSEQGPKDTSLSSSTTDMDANS